MKKKNCVFYEKMSLPREEIILCIMISLIKHIFFTLKINILQSEIKQHQLHHYLPYPILLVSGLLEL